jgi:hypothetical protein
LLDISDIKLILENHNQLLDGIQKYEMHSDIFKKEVDDLKTTLEKELSKE